MDDPTIEVFDASRYAGMECYAADSVRLAKLFRSWATEAASVTERVRYLQTAEMHNELARVYRLGDRIVKEVEEALAQEAT